MNIVDIFLVLLIPCALSFDLFVVVVVAKGMLHTIIEVIPCKLPAVWLISLVLSKFCTTDDLANVGFEAFVEKSRATCVSDPNRAFYGRASAEDSGC